jgi:hypothetical protein
MAKESMVKTPMRVTGHRGMGPGRRTSTAQVLALMPVRCQKVGMAWFLAVGGRRTEVGGRRSEDGGRKGTQGIGEECR